MCCLSLLFFRFGGVVRSLAGGGGPLSCPLLLVVALLPLLAGGGSVRSLLLVAVALLPRVVAGLCCPLDAVFLCSPGLYA